jgi:hypothetical protein
MSKKSTQGIGHLASIFLLPFIIVGIYFSPNWIVRIVIIVASLLFFILLWNKVLKK